MMPVQINVSSINQYTAGIHTGFPRWIILCTFTALFIFSLFTNALGENIQSVLEKSGYSPSLKQSITNLIVEAEAEGIPGELILPRLEEGVAKSVPGEKVLNVLRDDIQRLKQAREILMEVEGGSVLIEDKAAWARTANLLAGGISPQEIKKITSFSKNRWKDYRSASFLFVSLVQWGLSKESSLELIRAVLSSPLRGEDFAGIVELFVEGRRLRIQPETLLQRMIEQLPEATTPQELREMILYR